MPTYTRIILAAALLLGSAAAASSRSAPDKPEGDSLRIATATTQVAQFNSRPAQQSSYRNSSLESFGGY